MDTTRRAALAAAIAIAAPAAPRAQGPAVITGTAAYRERIAMMAGAVLEVELVDITRADAPVQRIAATRVEVRGEVPIPFTLPYDPARIVPTHAYSVQARLLYGSEITFRSDGATPVLTRGAGRVAEILLVRARSQGAAAGDAPGLVGPLWVAEDIGGRGVTDRLQTNITFTAEGRAQGSGGCNRFAGGYALDGSTLRIGPVASTNMACVPAAMEQEQRFHAALAGVRGWRIEGGMLHLTGERGVTLARLSRAR